MARSSGTLRPERLAVLVAALLGSVASSTGAQATTGSVHGTILASDGSIPVGATVHAENRATAIRRNARVDGTGAYRLLGLPSATYTVSVRALGYRQQRRDSVRLVHGQRVQLDFTLDRGAVELEPMIVQAGGALEVERNDVSSAVLQEEIDNLPLNTRNVLNLAAIAPGIRTFAIEGGRSQPVAGALPSTEARFANLYVDGVDLRGIYAPGIIAGPSDGSMVPQEAVREFRVYLNPYDAEFTRGGSYVMSAITHQGSNTLEGSLFNFHQNRELIARSSVQAKKPSYRRDQFGANVRGPLIRDRLFFSLSYESQITDNYIDVVVPSPAAQPDRWAAYAGTFKAPSRLHNTLARLTAPVGAHLLDATLSVRDLSRESVFGTYEDNRLLVRDAGRDGASRLTNLQLRDTYTGPALVNELTVHVFTLRNQQDIINPGPTLQYPGIQIGHRLFPFAIADRHLTLINRATYTLGGPVGHHVLKAGLEIKDLWPRVARPNNSRGLFVFPTDTSTLPFVARIGVAAPGFEDAVPGSSSSHGWSAGAYLQDEWRPVRRLSITAGARWDADVNTNGQNVIAPWAQDPALLQTVGEGFLNTGDRRNDLDNIAPRVAITWDATGRARTFLRSGYGVMYDRVPTLGSIVEARDIGWRIYSIPTPGTTDVDSLRRLIAAGGGAARRTLQLIKDDLETPRTRQWSVGVGHVLRHDVALNVDYVDQRVSDAYVTLLLNRSPNVIAPAYGDITLWDDFGDARYRAMLVSLTYDARPTRVSVAYTLSQAESEFGRTTDSSYPDEATYAMQRSEADERHRVVLSAFGRLPLGLDVSALAILASPRPFLVTTRDVNANGNEFDDWPGGVRTHAVNGWRHWYRAVDVRLAKSLPAARGRITVSVDVFNLFNTANHSEYQPNATLPDYANPTVDFARRQGQVGLRYWF